MRTGIETRKVKEGLNMYLHTRFPRSGRFTLGFLVMLMVLSFIAGEAGAFLKRVGPLNPAPSVGNFPAWYQDNTGLTMEFCAPSTQSEVDGGWCLLLPADVTIPEVFPTNFFDEHFYYAASADPVAEFPNSPLNRAVLVLALEGAFATGPAIPGNQIVFARIRVDLRDAPATGTYRFIHPYGIDEVNATAGQRIFITEDIGIACPPGDFSCALNSRLGPFLLPSATPGGAETPPLTAANPTPDTDPNHFGGVFTPTAYPLTGKSYIADPARIGPVTGSPTDNNFFRVEGPPGSNLDGNGNDFIVTSNFNLVGRIFTDAIPGEVTVDRANYTRNASEQKVEVYARGFETTQGRLPAAPPPAAVLPQLSFFDLPCGLAPDNTTLIAPTGANETQMFHAGNDFWAGAPVAPVPTGVCVKDSVSLAFFQKTVVDEVTISQAYFNPAGPNLSVIARSSDEIALPTLTLGGFGDLTNGAILVSPLAAPPSHVHVQSSQGGANLLQVSTAPPIVVNPANAVTLTAAPPGTSQSGDNVTFTGLASGGSGNYEYQFMAAAAGSDFVVAQPYTPTASWVWNTTGAPAGAYIVQVFARSIGSVAALEALGTVNYTLTVAGTAPTSITLAAAPADNTLAGGSVTYTATVNDGTGPFEYEFRARVAPGGTFAVAQPYTRTNNWTWNTAGSAPGSYEIQVNVRRVGQPATEATTTIQYAILSASTAPTSVSLTAVPADNTATGGNVTYTATVNDGTGPFEYEFRARAVPGGSFAIAQPFTPTNNWSWNTAGTPAGDYEIQVNVRRAGQPATETTTTIPYVLTP
jgi:hypothetical protein